jgi:hypothetical protein
MCILNLSEEQDEDDENEEEDDLKLFDSLFKSDIIEWIKTLTNLFLNHSEHHRLEAVLRNSIDSVAIINEYSTLHFENIFFVLQHLLRAPEAFRFSYLIHLPMLIDSNEINQRAVSSNTTELLLRQLSLDNFKSDQLINLYFDFYLKVLGSFSHGIKYRREFLFFNDKFLKETKNNLSNTDNHEEEYSELNMDSMVGVAGTMAQAENASNNHAHWEFVNLEGDFETIESVMIEISEDDLIKMYYQIPLNKLFAFLWTYLEFQETSFDSNSSKNIYPQNFSTKSKFISI